MVLIAQEEYTSGEENDEEEETTPATSLVAMAKNPPPSLFDSPNEKAPIPNASCFMAKSSEVSSSKT